MPKDDLDIGHARDQGAAARELNDDDSNNTQVLPHDCPYGPGERRDAWMEGAGFPKEEVEQVDTSTPNTDDVRIEPPKTVREAPKRRSSRKGKGKAKASAGDRTKVSTATTGNAETALVTKTGTAKPEEASQANIETKLGDPRGTEGDRTQVDPEKLM